MPCREHLFPYHRVIIRSPASNVKRRCLLRQTGTVAIPDYARTKRGRPPSGGDRPKNCSGSDLLFRAVTHRVPSALEGGTAVFGMGTGGTPPPWPPKQKGQHRVERERMHRERGDAPPPEALGGAVKGSTDSYPSAERVTTLTRRADQPGVLPGVLSPEGEGDLILGWASRLDAFSAYPVPTPLPSVALGRTAGTREVGPPRSSRTRGGSPQVSNARDG